MHIDILYFGTMGWEDKQKTGLLPNVYCLHKQRNLPHNIEMQSNWNPEYLYIVFAWVVTIPTLLLLIPKNKISVAVVAFLFMQLLTWVLGLIVVQLGLIEYPVRLFPKANMTSFTFEFLVYPSICAIFMVHYPENKSRLKQLLYYAAYCTGITIVEVLVERYTDIIVYKHWRWYTTWLSLLATLYINRKLIGWFFRRVEKEARMH